MIGFQKRLFAGAVASLLWIGSGSAAFAQTADHAARLDELHVELAEPGREDWTRVEAEIVRLWSQSGSPAMDLLLRRASEAMEAEEFEIAVEHLSALTDHAPGFAEGWNARATAFYFLGEFTLAMADIQRTLALNPRHFGAMEGLGAILEEMDQPEFALRALRAAEEINPNRPSLKDAVARLERKAGAAEL